MIRSGAPGTPSPCSHRPMLPLPHSAPACLSSHHILSQRDYAEKGVTRTPHDQGDWSSADREISGFMTCWEGSAGKWIHYDQRAGVTRELQARGLGYKGVTIKRLGLQGSGG